MKKTIFSILTLFFITTYVHADTTIVRIHDHTDMTWYGNYDKWGVLPDKSKTYLKINLHYTMGCATNGCSDWDYTTKIEVLHRTGKLDSTIFKDVAAPISSPKGTTVPLAPGNAIS